MKYSIEEILESFDEPGNAKAVSAEFSADGNFIKSVTFSCEKEGCNCCGGWTTGIGRTVAAQMGEGYNRPETAPVPRRERPFTPRLLRR